MLRFSEFNQDSKTMNIVEYRICYRKISLLKLWKKMEINGGKGRFGGSEKGAVHLSWNTAVDGRIGAPVDIQVLK